MPEKARYLARKLAGVCVWCGTRKPAPNRVRCPECLSSGRSTYAARVASKVCVKCARPATARLCADCTKKNAARCHRYYKGHAKGQATRARDWRARNGRDCAAENRTPACRRQKRRWAKLHPESGRAKAARYRCKKLGAKGNAGERAILMRMAIWGFRCWICGGPYDEIDHVIPLSRGGTNWPANLRPACRECNARKGARSPRLGSGRSQSGKANESG
jgi:5-methylcytosine-specific restriction endonuclease McrA